MEALNNSPGRETTLPEDDTTPGEKRHSMVAERRKLFEVTLADSRLNAPIDSSPGSRHSGKKFPLLSKWQTFRARSPLACMAQSQTAVLSRPAIPNVSQRLSEYLPLSSTCPSLANVRVAATPHTLSECRHRGLNDGNLAILQGPSILPSAVTAQHTQHLDVFLDPVSQFENQEIPRESVKSVVSFSSRCNSKQSFATQSNITEPAAKEILLRKDAGQRVIQPPQPPDFIDEVDFVTAPGIQNNEEYFSGGTTGSVLKPAFRQIPSRTSSRQQHEEKQTEITATHFETSPKKSLDTTASQINNTIVLFESLIAGDEATTSKRKNNPSPLKPLTASSSCHLSTPLSKIKTGTMESTRRKFSNSWGPARFQKSRAHHSSDAARPNHSDELAYKKPNRRRWERNGLFIDGTTEGKHPDLNQWPGRPGYSNQASQAQHPNAFGSVGLGPQIPVPQSGSTTIGCSISQTQQEYINTSFYENDNYGHTSWRSRRRWVSRSTPLIGRVDCALEQPKPIRVSEMKRLVSLCRDKVAGRKYRAKTE
ncbi:hypothetical protein QQS21_011737 [Conoideocrella luteorostrata]|uniref:Uncharacterized protein n=1 Tax=Conoideocrella luteorostrata TaxID=1105319 RepID=A0AAJ0CCU6_9HYPO|nr:hypothetical protein QQS21_011737 [Conoideocrella luteorostrata]